jgi:hypothetical protein
MWHTHAKSAEGNSLIDARWSVAMLLTLFVPWSLLISPA